MSELEITSLPEKKHRIGVVGAGGQLGGFIIRALAESGAHVTGFARAALPTWPKNVQFCSLHSSSPTGTLAHHAENLDAVIFAAPVDQSSYLEALENQCHIIDVGIEAARIRMLLGLGHEAQQRGLTILVMAGLAPGLMGMLGSEMDQSEPEAYSIQVALIQSAVGTAGLQGTRDMLDVLTGPDSRSAKTHVNYVHNKALKLERLRRFPTAETEIWPASPSINFYTGFDDQELNRNLRILTVLRRAMPPAYSWLRDRFAKQKALAQPRDDESVTLSAVAVSETGSVMACRSILLTSDYGATAAIATAMAYAALGETVATGAMPMGLALSLRNIVENGKIKSTILGVL